MFMNKFDFKKYQPLSLRAWHWLNAIALFGLLGTVLIRKTLLSWRTNSVLIQDKLNETGVVITADLAKQIAVAIRNPLWDWHIYLGYLLTALIIGRLIVSITANQHLSYRQFILNFLNIKNTSAAEKKKAFHYSVVKAGYALFYFAAFFMVVTGLILTFKANLNFSTDFTGAIKEFHEMSMWFFVIFIAGHLFGIIWSENNGSRGITSDMINGGD